MHYKVQIDDEVRDATDDEIEDIKQRQADAQAAQHAVDDVAAAKQSALVKLAALGLTADEIAALIP
jgi:DNA-directed RNA polymerase specialized sigma24 family protein